MYLFINERVKKKGGKMSRIKNTISKKELKLRQEESIRKIKQKFFDTAKELGVKAEEINIIKTSDETFFNPLNGSFNRWVKSLKNKKD